MTNDYRQKLEESRIFQDKITILFHKKLHIPLNFFCSEVAQMQMGENYSGIEIKNDKKFRTTGNLYIEIAEKSDAQNTNFVDSGIYRKDNSWAFAIGDEQTMYLFLKKVLVKLCEENGYTKVIKPTSIGFLLPVVEAEKWAVKITGTNVS
jgi:hypothetical protein